MNFDEFFTRKYDDDEYNCLHFTRDVWKKITNEDITEKLEGLLGAANARELAPHTFHNFKRLPRAASPCIVYMLSMRKDPHVGVYLNKKLLHITDTGVSFFPFEIATVSYNSFRFYR